MVFLKIRNTVFWNDFTQQRDQLYPVFFLCGSHVSGFVVLNYPDYFFNLIYLFNVLAGGMVPEIY